MKSGRYAAFLALALLGGCGDAGSSNATSGNQSSGGATGGGGQTFKLGDAVNFGVFEITLETVEQKQQVGGAMDVTKAADGGTLVAITYTLKNTGKKPLGMFDRPSLQLIDPDGQRYSSDVGATSSLRIEKDFTAKMLSDLNPAITTTDGVVFEVSKNQFDRKTWKVILEGHETTPIGLR
ncbi:MAG: DUF4352 domain-containing protein [Proteobacteria bacterium]|nr:DUF4352 domain-containing protein [Pseudomonadota bacterium]